MGRTAATVDLPYPATTVFEVATRVPDLPRWLPDLAAAELLDPQFAKGSRVRLQFGAAAANAVIVGTVERLKAPEAIEIAGAGGPVNVRVIVALTPTGPSATRVQLAVEIQTPPFLGFIAKEAERRIQAELPASLERFRALVDAEPA
jgi:hypothetical protein